MSRLTHVVAKFLNFFRKAPIAKIAQKRRCEYKLVGDYITKFIKVSLFGLKEIITTLSSLYVKPDIDVYLRQHDRQCIPVDVFLWGPIKNLVVVFPRAHRVPRGSKLALLTGWVC